jgi:hypothetical protein
VEDSFNLRVWVLICLNQVSYQRGLPLSLDRVVALFIYGCASHSSPSSFPLSIHDQLTLVTHVLNNIQNSIHLFTTNKPNPKIKMQFSIAAVVAVMASVAAAQ